MPDPFDLQRFVDAQDPVIDRVLAELRAGRKQSHWMWFVFPQIRGLGHSPMAQAYGVASADEAVAYLGHPVLGPRLERCTRLVLDSGVMPVDRLFGAVDAMKFHASMTLFDTVTGRPSLFEEALRTCFGGRVHAATKAML